MLMLNWTLLISPLLLTKRPRKCWLSQDCQSVKLTSSSLMRPFQLWLWPIWSCSTSLRRRWTCTEVQFRWVTLWAWVDQEFCRVCWQSSRAVVESTVWLQFATVVEELQLWFSRTFSERILFTLIIFNFNFRGEWFYLFCSLMGDILDNNNLINFDTIRLWT